VSHIIKKYNLNEYNFNKLVGDLFNIDNLTSLHHLEDSLCSSELLDQSNETETFFHNVFYSKLKEGWPEIEKAYEDFILNEVSPLFEEDFLYQKFPTFRVQVPNQTAVSKWHYDSDEDHKHPDWEINFQIALTEMNDSSATWVETVPGLNDFSPMNMEEGEFCIFNGNKCRHGNKANKTGKTRVSFDFRVLPISRHDENTTKESYYGRKFAEGGYYKRFRKNVV
jgi:hypothetical protein